MTTEDTRKDKRAKIVSLNVRYKSATVDEFIENHSHDVSKGGLFIKTPTPFPPGTLIKFEIRIAGDKPVIMGVGRVVWKREPSQAGAERPSGMGVKFIKIDDSSRHVIERVVAEKEGAGSAYATENEDGSARPPPVEAPKDPNLTPKPGSIRPGEVRKETIMGIGASVPPPKDEAASSAVGMFPTSEPEAPKKEQTVMKQAAELLEEALKEAGGSMEEIGNNPLFAEGNRLEPRVGTTGPAMDAPLDKVDRKKTLLGVAPAAQPAKPTSGAMKAEAKVASDPPKRTSGAAPAKSESSSAKLKAADSAPAPRRTTDPPRKVAKAAAVVDDDLPLKKSSSGMMFWLAVAVIVLGGAAFLYKDNLLAGDAPVPTQTAIAPTPAPPPLPVPPPAPTPTSVAPAPSAATSASAAPSASASAHAPTTAVATANASSTPKPTATAAPIVTATAAPAITAAPTPKPPPAPKPTATPAAAPAGTGDTPPPAPKPKPKPKPAAAPADDNPY